MNVTQEMIDVAEQVFDDTYDVESFPTGMSDNKRYALKAAIEAALRAFPLPEKIDLSKWDGPMNCAYDHDAFIDYGRDLGWNACIAAIAAQQRKEGESKKHDGPCWRNSHSDCGC